MKIMEFIKANKGAIVKRGLIILGTAVGLIVISKVLMPKGAVTELPAEESDGTEVDEEEDSEEE